MHNFDYLLLLFFQDIGGSIVFVKDNSSIDAATNAMRGEDASLLIYVNGSHEFFDPRDNEESQINKLSQKSIQADEPGEFGVWLCC
jgi:hypothetical protein